MQGGSAVQWGTMCRGWAGCTGSRLEGGSQQLAVVDAGQDLVMHRGARGRGRLDM